MPVQHLPPAGLGFGDREVDQFAGGVLGREVPAGLDDLAGLPVQSLDRVGIRYERHQMPSAPGVTGPLQLLSVSGSVSTVRPSGSRGIRERTQAGQAVLIRCALSAG